MLIADTKTKWSVIHSVTSNSLQPHGLEFSRLPYPQKSPGKNTGVDIHSFLQGIFPTQDQTWISCIVGGLFTVWKYIWKKYLVST